MPQPHNTTFDSQTCFQFIKINAGQAAYLAGRLEPYDCIPDLWTADLQILKDGRARALTVDTIRALSDFFGYQFIEDLRLLE